MSGPEPTRRRFLQAGMATGLGTIGTLSGCLESRSPYAPPVVSDRPDAVYVPAHFEEMAPIGTDSSGPLSVALMYSYPHRFWLLSGADRSRVRIKPADSIHLMFQVWDTEWGVPVSGSSPRVVIAESDSVVSDRIFWPMLSQRMGFHYGDNVQLDGDGRYSIRVDVPPTSDVTVGPLSDRPDGYESFQFDFRFRRADLEELGITNVAADRAGSRAALSPMTGGPGPTGADNGELPGRSLGTEQSDEMALTASIVFETPGPPALLLTARTPYNKFPIPLAGPVASVGGSTHRLRAAIDPEFGMHYRLPLADSTLPARIQVEIPTPPQVARHEGYETAFMAPEPVTFEVS